jgi:hypothetical protein
LLNEIDLWIYSHLKLIEKGSSVEKIVFKMDKSKRPSRQSTSEWQQRDNQFEAFEEGKMMKRTLVLIVLLLAGMSLQSALC